MADANEVRFKLSYFNGKGLGEPSRMLMAYQGVPFIDKRYPFEAGPPVKRDEFDEAQSRGEFPFFTMPMLEVDGRKISHSKAIERYLAREFNMLGNPQEDNFFTAQIEQLGEQILDMRNAWRDVRWRSSEAERAAKIESYYTTLLPDHLYAIEPNMLRRANAADDNYLYGGAGQADQGAADAKDAGIKQLFTLADIQLVSALDAIDDQARVQALLDEKFPKVAARRALVLLNPRIAAYIANRPISSF